MENTIPQKQCTGPCQRMLLATSEFFGPDKRRSYGLQSQCRDCHRESNRLSRQKHKEEINERARISYQAYREERRAHYAAYVVGNQAYKEKRRMYMRIYIQARKEERNEYSRAYYQTHREERCAYGRAHNQTHKKEKSQRDRAYRQTHMEAHRASNHKRHALKRGSKGSYTVEDIQRQYRAQKGKCYYCHKKLGEKYHRDHIVPLIRGGSNTPDNIVLTCPTCNLRKNKKLPHEWSEGGRLL